MAKGNRAGWLVRPHGIKRKHDLAATPHPTAMLGHAVLADVKSVESGGAIRSQAEGENPFRRIRRRRVALISTSKISLLPPDKADGEVLGRALHLRSGASGWDEPAERQQGTRKLRTEAKESRSSGVHDDQ
jgi:hypothetical protein